MEKRSVVHVEIPAADRDAAAKFYEALCGWSYEHVEEPSPYTMFEGGNTGGGFPDVNEEVQPGDVLVYLDSKDIEADLAQVEALGGKVLLPKTPIGDMGWLAMFSDPTGNRLAFWQSVGQG